MSFVRKVGIFLSFLLAFPTLSQGERQLPVAPPRASHAQGLGRCVRLGSPAARPRPHLTEALSP